MLATPDWVRRRKAWGRGRGFFNFTQLTGRRVMATWLVTGGAGFIGSALVRMLLDETSHRVVNVDKLTYAGNLESLPGADGNSRYSFEHLDICDAAAMRDCFQRHRPDTVIHLSLIHISEPTRLGMISYAVFCL